MHILRSSRIIYTGSARPRLPERQIHGKFNRMGHVWHGKPGIAPVLGECILAAILNRTKTWGSSLAVLWWCSPCGLVAVAVVLLAVVVIVNLVVLAGAVVAVLQHGLRIYAGTG